MIVDKVKAFAKSVGRKVKRFFRKIKACFCVSGCIDEKKDDKK